MDLAFIALLFFTSLTGLLLLALRATSVIPLLLAIHLAAVFALFPTLPFGKFVQGARHESESHAARRPSQ